MHLGRNLSRPGSRKVMPERPLLILPSPGDPVARQKKRGGGGGGKFHRPSVERQAERLSPQFERLQQALERARLRIEARDLVPEQVVVLETVGTVDDFIRAVNTVPGLEWLAEVDADDIPPDDDFFGLTNKGEAQPDKALQRRLYMVITNQEGLEHMISLWEKWRSDEELPKGKRKWKTIFGQLRSVRKWGVQDRLRETGYSRTGASVSNTARSRCPAKSNFGTGGPRSSDARHEAGWSNLSTRWPDE